MVLDMSKIQKAGNEVSEVLEKNNLYEIEALTVLECVRISIEASIMKKSCSFGYPVAFSQSSGDNRKKIP